LTLAQLTQVVGSAAPISENYTTISFSIPQPKVERKKPTVSGAHKSPSAATSRQASALHSS